ncbi:MAG: hypothetical protein KF716_07050 [Anaerolineae bacterium]|nr:hypothetical protein [Anaerolineae bacterium]
MNYLRWFREHPFLTVGVGSFLLAYIALGNETFRSIFPLVYVWLLAVVLSMLIAIIVHELGHLIAGLLVGYRFSMFAILHFRIYREDNKLSISWRQSQLYKTRYLGFVRFFIDDFTNFRQRRFWLTLGGPLATALTVVVAGVLYANRPPLPPGSTPSLITAQDWLQRFLPLGLFMVDLAFLVLTLYPTPFNEGNVLLLLLRGGATLEQYQRLIQISNADAQGVRPRDWDISLINALLDSNADEFTSHLLLYYWALDHHDQQQARTALAAAIKSADKASAPDRAEIAVEAVYLDISDRANAQDIEQLIAKLGKAINRAQPITRMRLACAANLALHQYAETRKIAHHALQLIEREKANTGGTIMERDLFHEMAERVALAEKSGVGNIVTAGGTAL